MDNQLLQQLKDALAKATNIGIAVAPNPSLDQMAAALGLSLLIQELNKPVQVVSPTDPIVEISNLVGINKVQKSFAGGTGSDGDLTVSFPYVEGEIEKVSYTQENGFLNIIVKPSEQGLSFTQQDVRFTRSTAGGDIDLLFTVGVKSLSDLGNSYNAQQMQNTPIINIDNSSQNQGFGTIVLVSPQASSVSEIIGDLALSLGFKIDPDAAQNLLNGITTVTNNFQEQRTSFLAFEVASYLMRRGAKRITSRPEPQDDFAAQFLNRPQPQAQQQIQQPAPTAQVAQPVQQPMQTVQQPQAATIEDRQEQLRQELRAFEQNQNQSNGQTTPAPMPEQPATSGQQDDPAPVDWLTPKVYKGSSNF